jgi:hypothetical protein
MGEDPGAVSASEVGRTDTAKTPDTPQELREEIERTRQDLGETVAALAEKSDVKARAKEKVSEVKGKVDEKRAAVMSRGGGESSAQGGPGAAAQVRQKAEENPIPTAALAAFVGGFIFGRVTKRT